MQYIRLCRAMGVIAFRAALAVALQTPPTPATLVIERGPQPRTGGGPIAQTPDIIALPIDDKEVILRNGKPDDVEKVWQSMKGRSVQIPDALVIEVSTRFIKVAVSDEAVASKTADFLVYLKSIKPPLVGTKVTFAGTYDSFTQNPMLIIMRDGVILSPSATRPRSSSSRK